MQRQQNSTSYPILFLLVSSTDHVTAVTGITPTVTISKNGGAFGSPSGAVSELANGWYALAGNATDRATLGQLLVHATGTGADPVDMAVEIVGWDPFAGSVASVTAGVTLAADQPVDVTKWKGATAPAMTGDAYARLGAPAGASISADVAAVKAETALIVADTNELQTDWANGGRLDLLLDAANNGSPPSVGDIADAVLEEMLSGHTTTGTVGKKLGELANPDLSGVATSTVAAAIQLVTDRLAAMLEDAGTYDRFLATALEEAPTGGSAGTGDFTQTITLTDGTDAIPGAWVTVRNVAETSLVAGPMMTDENGQVAPKLDAGTYHVLVRTTPAYEPHAAVELVVTATGSLTVTLTPVVISVPTDPTLCRVYGRLVSGIGVSRIADVRFYAATNGEQDAIIVSKDFVAATSDATGYLEIDLVRTVVYKVTSEYYIQGFKLITIPDAGTASLETLLDAAP